MSIEDDRPSDDGQTPDTGVEQEDRPDAEVAAEIVTEAVAIYTSEERDETPLPGIFQLSDGRYFRADYTGGIMGGTSLRWDEEDKEFLGHVPKLTTALLAGSDEFYFNHPSASNFLRIRITDGLERGEVEEEIDQFRARAKRVTG